MTKGQGAAGMRIFSRESIVVTGLLVVMAIGAVFF